MAISKYDRFNSCIKDSEKISCKYCEGETSYNNAIYDESECNYFCDIGCFRDWADDNFDVVVKLYEELNIN